MLQIYYATGWRLFCLFTGLVRSHPAWLPTWMYLSTHLSTTADLLTANTISLSIKVGRYNRFLITTIEATSRLCALCSLRISLFTIFLGSSGRYCWKLPRNRLLLVNTPVIRSQWCQLWILHDFSNRPDIMFFFLFH